uniref:hypothetical protein n=1 Tax=Fulvivirga sp. TaxID=1931237 RepID=UPI00404A806A
MLSIILRAALISSFLMLSVTSCQKKANSNHRAISSVSTPEFAEYWYAGKAELVSYNLKQSRYGEVHDGKAVLIFVTEPFSKKKQVKLDNGEAAGEDKQTVLKLNFTKKFTTGIYPYSMMLSAFTPVELNKYPNTPKVTMSSQEWCGHVFSQMNLKKNEYELASYSYFEQEGDANFNLDKALLEDELWNRIRLDYKSLPTGEFDIIPGLFHTRLLHKNLKAVKVQGVLEEKDTINSYTIIYPDRMLKIEFESTFPYKILGWEEEFNGLGGKKMITSASIDKTLNTDYWSKNNNKDKYLRDSLNLQ